MDHALQHVPENVVKITTEINMIKTRNTMRKISHAILILNFIFLWPNCLHSISIKTLLPGSLNGERPMMLNPSEFDTCIYVENLIAVDLRGGGKFFRFLLFVLRREGKSFLSMLLGSSPILVLSTASIFRIPKRLERHILFQTLGLIKTSQFLNICLSWEVL